jgi:aarF domain-containing kinase
MPDEEAFSLLVRLMQMYDLRGHYMPEMPKLQMRLVRSLFNVTYHDTDPFPVPGNRYFSNNVLVSLNSFCVEQFDRLIEELLPVLHFHFLRQGIKSSMFCSQWFLTMYSYRWGGLTY